jgi:hypothetical protein
MPVISAAALAVVSRLNKMTFRLDGQCNVYKVLWIWVYSRSGRLGLVLEVDSLEEIAVCTLLSKPSHQIL